MIKKAEFSRSINKSSLILTAESNSQSDRDSIEMFHYNKIPCFLTMRVQQQGLELQYYYDIAGRRSLDQLLEYKALDYTMLFQILYSFDQACIQAEKYLLAENDILLDAEFIFTESEPGRVMYCYFPGNGTDICKQFQLFMEYLLQKLEHKDERAVQLAYGVHQRVSEEKAALHSVLAEITKGGMEGNIIKSLKMEKLETEQYEQKEAQDTMQSQAMPKQPFIQKSAQSSVYEDVADCMPQKQSIAAKKKTKVGPQPSKHPKEVAKKQQPAEKLKNLLRKKIYTDGQKYMEGEFVTEEDIQEEVVRNPTVCLMAQEESIQNQFIYQGADRSRDFCCKEGKMILGSSIEESDICIPLPLVSRVHARVEVKEEGTFIEDMNSKNGTHVNGELLQYRKKCKLEKGDIISLAGESYSFH